MHTYEHPYCYCLKPSLQDEFYLYNFIDVKNGVRIPSDPCNCEYPCPRTSIWRKCVNSVHVLVYLYKWEKSKLKAQYESSPIEKMFNLEEAESPYDWDFS